MNFIKKYEIFPQNSEKLKKVLFTELNGEKKYKAKPDHHLDQVKIVMTI